MIDKHSESLSEDEKVEIEQMADEFIEEASGFPIKTLITVITWMFRHVNNYKADMDNEEVDYLISSIFEGLEDRRDEIDDEFYPCDYTRFLQIFSLFYEWYKTSIFRTIKNAVGQGLAFSDILETLIDQEALDRLSTLNKI